MNYYYSKFDNMNWSWWDEKNIPDGTKVLLESVNRQLNAYYPAKFLLFLSMEQYFMLISERNQLDRDNGGRTFSIRHFMLVNKDVLQGEDTLKNILESFIEPADPRNPTTPGERSYFAGTAYDPAIFEELITTLPGGKRLCIINNQIDDYPHNDKAGITALNFSNFPGASPLIQTLQLLPFPVLKKISFCLNYENDFINISQNKLANINILLCGKKALVENTFTVDHDIHHNGLSFQGFVVTKQEEWEFAAPVRGGLFEFLLEQQKEPHGYFNDILLAWDHENSTADMSEALKFCMQLFELEGGKSITAEHVPVIESIIQLKGLSVSVKSELFHKLLDALTAEEVRRQLYKYAMLAQQVGLNMALFPQLLEKLVLAKLSLSQSAGIIDNTRFYSLHEELRDKLLELFAAGISSWKDFSGDTCIQILRKHHSEFKTLDLANIWHELLTTRNISYGPADFQRVQFLYKISSDEDNYSQLLTQRFNDKWDEQWLKEARLHKLKISPDISGLKGLKDLMHVSTLFQIYTDEISTKKRQEVAKRIKDELGETRSIVDLVNLFNSSEGGSKRNKTTIREQLIEAVESELDKDPGILLGKLKEIRTLPNSQELLGSVFDKLFKKEEPGHLNSRMLLNVVQLYHQSGEKQEKRRKKLESLSASKIFEWLPENGSYNKGINRSLVREFKKLNINLPDGLFYDAWMKLLLSKIFSFFKKIFYARVHKK